LRAALAGLPADRRQDIIEGVSQHIADARLQLGQDSQEGDDAIRGILGQLGDPDVIAADALDAERGSAAAGPPRSVRHAVWLMYAGAAMSLAAVIADIATKNELREVLAKTPMTRNLIGTATTATFTPAAAVSLAGVVLFLLTVTEPGRRSARGRWLRGCSRLPAGRPERDRVLVAENLDRLHQGPVPLTRLAGRYVNAPSPPLSALLG
jgi:hypothetical protein